jgi:hypothetical protein
MLNLYKYSLSTSQLKAEIFTLFVPFLSSCDMALDSVLVPKLGLFVRNLWLFKCSKGDLP